MWYLRQVFNDYDFSDFVSVTLGCIGFALCIYTVATVP